MRNSILLFSATILVTTSPAFAQEAKKSQNGFCIEEMNNELKNLGMGTFTAPAKGVEREANDKFVSFTRDIGEVSPAVYITKLFGGSVQTLNVRMPTVLFGRLEEKEISFNENCEVKSVGLSADGVAAHLPADRCRAILKARKASLAKSLGNNIVENSLKGEYPKHGWAKCDNIFSSAVVDLCRDYADKFEKAEGGAPPEGNGDDGKPGTDGTAK